MSPISPTSHHLPNLVHRKLFHIQNFVGILMRSGSPGSRSRRSVSRKKFISSSQKPGDGKKLSSFCARPAILPTSSWHSRSAAASRRLVRFERAGRQLPQPPVHDIPVLPHEQDAVRRRHRQQHDRSAMTHALHLHHAAVRVAYLVDSDRKDTAFVDAIGVLQVRKCFAHIPLAGFD